MFNQTFNPQQILLKGGIRVGTIAALLLAIGSSFFGSEIANAQVPNRPSPENLDVTIDDILDDSTRYNNRLVSIRSEADETNDAFAYVLDDEDGINLFGLDFDEDELLVFNGSGTPFTLQDDSNIEIQVTGVVRPFNRVEFERLLGVTLDREFYAEYENQPAVIAQSLAYAPDPGEVSAQPEDFYGRAIAVEGNVDDIYSRYAFTLNDPDLLDEEDLLVINANPEQRFGEDRSVIVVGELRPFVLAEIERDYNLGVDLGLPSDLEVDYEERPVLIVREVYPAAE
ncbi:MAG: hypothetical protein MUF72_23470 [Elainella sp. Prado103]|jgi:hypothetical protein|nr:hypothetical protein [Elainella sp. Prado103]